MCNISDDDDDENFGDLICSKLAIGLKGLARTHSNRSTGRTHVEIMETQTQEARAGLPR